MDRIAAAVAHDDIGQIVAENSVAAGVAGGVFDLDALVDGEAAIGRIDIGHRAAAGVAEIIHGGRAQVDQGILGQGQVFGGNGVRAAGVPDAHIAGLGTAAVEIVGIVARMVGRVGAVLFLQLGDIDRHRRGVEAVVVVLDAGYGAFRPAVIVRHDRIDTLVMHGQARIGIGVRDAQHEGRTATIVERMRQAKAMAEFVDQGIEAQSTGFQRTAGGSTRAARTRPA